MTVETGFGPKDRLPQQDARTRRAFANLGLKLDEPSGLEISFSGLKGKAQDVLVIDTAGFKLVFAGGLYSDSGTLKVDHDVTINFVANEHIDHTAVTLTAGVGLVGGGDISVSRTFDLDVPGLTTDTAPTGTDYIITYDTETSTHKKALLSSIGSAVETDPIAMAYLDQSVKTTASPSFLNVILGTVAVGGRTIVLAPDAVGVFDPNAGVSVVNPTLGYGTWQSASAFDGVWCDTNGDWSRWGDLFLNYYSTGNVYLTPGAGRTFFGSSLDSWAGSNQANTLFLGNNVVIADETSLGTELITNGGFDADTNWTKGTGWRITGGVAESYATGTHTIRPTVAPTIVAGHVYLLSFDIPTMTVTGLEPVAIGGLTIAPAAWWTSTGTAFKYIIKPTSTSNLIFTRTGNAARFTLDNVSLKEITGGRVEASYFQIRTAPTGNSTGTVSIVAKDANSLTANAGWLPFKKSDGTVVYVPYWA